MFYIRTDANDTIALGHVMRCMAIAREIKRQGEECTFIIADNHPRQLIVDNGYSVICLDSSWNDLELEIDKIIEVIKMNRIENLLIDTYYVTEKYLSTLREYTKISYIDDISKLIYPVDILINYNISHFLFSYNKLYDGDETRLLLGCDYVPLREEFVDIEPIIREDVSKILVTTGGSDPYNFMGRFLEFIVINELFEDMEFHGVAGRFNNNIDNLRRLESEYKNIIIHQDVANMSELITMCDLAVSAGGSTLYELCACGVPTISFTFADNQINGAVGFARKGIINYAGDVRQGEECISAICKKLNEYIYDVDRMEISLKMSQLVDGKGAERLAYELGGI